VNKRLIGRPRKTYVGADVQLPKYHWDMALWGGRKKTNSENLFNAELPISQEVATLLDSIDMASVILAPGEIPLYFSPTSVALGVIRDERITAPNLLALLRVVRRTGETQSGVIEIPRGPIGEGTRQLSVKISKLGDNGLLLAILSDQSEAERIDAVRRDFVANISHELKTPIGALSLLSEAVLGASDDPEAIKNFANRMQTEAKRLSDLVQEIINLSRLQDVDPLLSALTVDIDEVVDQAMSQCQLHADDRLIELSRGPLSGASVVGDRTQLIMAVHNLIENAINYSPDKTKVSINTELQDGIVQVTIIDQGIGIPEGEAERIFERFYRVDPARSRETGGTGLGLSIVKHVARIHGGDVSVWSSPGVGSSFSLRFPVGKDEITDEELT
jgi:two-component system, OmpR family, sensor histidine kinase SenX3